MKEDIAELVKLYNEGSKANADFIELSSSIIPDRPSYDMRPQVVIVNSLGRLGLAYAEPEPEHGNTLGVLQSVQEYINNWTQAIEEILDRIGKTRYKIQFNNPQPVAIKHLSIKYPTINESMLKEDYSR